MSNRADRRRPGDEIVLIVVARCFVEVRMEAELRGVAFRKKILPENVEHDDALIARVELIEIGISVFLAHVERDDVVLPPVVVVVAEEAEAEIRIVKDEAAEIAHERLNPKARRKEMVVVRQVADVNSPERFREAG